MERAAYNGAGFLIRKDDNNYIRLDRATYWDGMMNQVYGNLEKFFTAVVQFDPK